MPSATYATRPYTPSQTYSRDPSQPNTPNQTYDSGQPQITAHPRNVSADSTPKHASSNSGSPENSQSKYVYDQENELEHDLPALQDQGNLEDADQLEPVAADDDPASYELVAPSRGQKQGYSLEKRSQTLFSREHLQVIFSDPALLFKFTAFLSAHRTQSVPILVYYLDALKAIRAIHYANAVCEGLDPIEGFDFSSSYPMRSVNVALEQKANQAFDVLVKEELPAYITHLYVQVVTMSISRRVTGSLAPHLQAASEGLAEVFCLTDPSRPDNPIVFASEGIHTMIKLICGADQLCRVSQNYTIWHELCVGPELSIPPGSIYQSTEYAQTARGDCSGQASLRGVFKLVSVVILPRRTFANGKPVVETDHRS